MLSSLRTMRPHEARENHRNFVMERREGCEFRRGTGHLMLPAHKKMWPGIRTRVRMMHHRPPWIQLVRCPFGKYQRRCRDIFLKFWETCQVSIVAWWSFLVSVNFFNVMTSDRHTSLTRVKMTLGFQVFPKSLGLPRKFLGWFGAASVVFHGSALSFHM